VIERTITTTTHGRYTVEPPAERGGPMLVGFHGYGEGADAQFARMHKMPGADRWTIVSIQGLHRFYDRRGNTVVASWMTRQDRELAIADNLAYVAAVVSEVAREWAAAPRIVFAGFSQGVAMAFRAAAASVVPVAGVIAAGGDIPPEIDRAGLARVGAALLCRGTEDEWYTSDKFGDDLRRFREAGVDAQSFEFDGGHVWSADVVTAAAEFLRGRL
jgi:predicted esterase